MDQLDPFFLWQALISEEEFGILRRDQNLLIDYAHFPHKLSELLERCRVVDEHPMYLQQARCSSYFVCL